MAANTHALASMESALRPWDKAVIGSRRKRAPQTSSPPTPAPVPSTCSSSTLANQSLPLNASSTSSSSVPSDSSTPVSIQSSPSSSASSYEYTGPPSILHWARKDHRRTSDSVQSCPSATPTPDEYTGPPSILHWIRRSARGSTKEFSSTVHKRWRKATV